MDHIREGVHGARSAKQAIAIGLSKARRAGVDLPPPKSGKTSEATRNQAAAFAASPRALSRQAHAAAGARERPAVRPRAVNRRSRLCSPVTRSPSRIARRLH